MRWHSEKKEQQKNISIRKTPASTWIFDDASIVFFMRLIRVPDLRHQKFRLETGYLNNIQPMTRTDFINRLITCISFFIANDFFSSFLSLIVREKKSIEFFLPWNWNYTTFYGANKKKRWKYFNATKCKQHSNIHLTALTSFDHFFLLVLISLGLRRIFNPFRTWIIWIFFGDVSADYKNSNYSNMFGTWCIDGRMHVHNVHLQEVKYDEQMTLNYVVCGN